MGQDHLEQVPSIYLRAQNVFVNTEGPDYVDPVIALEGDVPLDMTASEEYIDALESVRLCYQRDEDIPATSHRRHSPATHRRRTWIETRIRL